MKLLRAALAALALASAPTLAIAADNVAVTAGSGKTIACKDSGGADATDTTNHAVKVTGQAGENHLGEIGGKTVVASANFTTPSGTTAYASGDLIANSGTAGSVTPLSFTVCRVNDGTVMIRRARIMTTDSGFAGKQVILKLYKSSPTVANGDNGAWSSTESGFLGQVPVTFTETFSDPLYKGIGAPAVGSEINTECSSGAKTVFGLLIAGEAITPQGAKVHTVYLEALAN
jgi:hypothetical protein